MARVIPFVLQVQDMDFFQCRIQECIVSSGESIATANDGMVAAGACKPHSGGIGKSLLSHSLQLLRQMKPIIDHQMHQFGCGEMVDTTMNPKLWKVDPIPNCAFEIKRKMATGDNHNTTTAEAVNVVKVNQGSSMRAPPLPNRLECGTQGIGFDRCWRQQE